MTTGKEQQSSEKTRPKSGISIEFIDPELMYLAIQNRLFDTSLNEHQDPWPPQESLYNGIEVSILAWEHNKSVKEILGTKVSNTTKLGLFSTIYIHDDNDVIWKLYRGFQQLGHSVTKGRADRRYDQYTADFIYFKVGEDEFEIYQHHLVPWLNLAFRNQNIFNVGPQITYWDLPSIPASFEEFNETLHRFALGITALNHALYIGSQKREPRQLFRFAIPNHTFVSLNKLENEAVNAYLSNKYAHIGRKTLGENIVSASSEEVRQFKALLKISAESQRIEDDIQFLCQSEENVERWAPHSDGVILQVGKKLLLNGQEQILNEEWQDWWSTPDGVCIYTYGKVISEQGDILVDNVEDLSSGMTHVQDIISGKNLILLDDAAKILEIEAKLDIINGIWVERRERNEFWMLDGGNEQLLYKGPWGKWKICKQGVIIQRGNQLLLNGNELLYEGEIDSWNTHQLGIVIQRGNQLLLNGTSLLFEGDFDEWAEHPNGIVIRKDNKWFLIKSIYFSFESK